MRSRSQGEYAMMYRAWTLGNKPFRQKLAGKNPTAKKILSPEEIQKREWKAKVNRGKTHSYSRISSLDRYWDRNRNKIEMVEQLKLVKQLPVETPKSVKLTTLHRLDLAESDIVIEYAEAA